MEYQQHKDVIAERMDVGNIIKNECYLDTLSQVLMTPYQVKLISHFKKSQDDETKQAFDIPITQAIETLTQKATAQSCSGNELKINEFLEGLIASVKKENPQNNPGSTFSTEHKMLEKN